MDVDDSAGVAEDGGQHETFCFFFVLYLPSPVLAFFFLSQEGSAAPFPRRPRSRILCTRDMVARHCRAWCEETTQVVFSLFHDVRI